MDETNTLLRKVINGQSAMKTELLVEIKKVNKKVENLSKETKEGFKKVNSRIDKLGKSLAYLEDDAPTRNEFEGLEKRVTKVESRISPVQR